MGEGSTSPSFSRPIPHHRLDFARRRDPDQISADEDVFFAAIVIDEAGNISEGDPGPDSDDDGSPDEIDCAPDDATLGGQRCE